MVSLLGEVERSANQEPLPGESRLPKVLSLESKLPKVLMNRAMATPVTIETAQKAKKVEAVAALSTSMMSCAPPAQEEMSIAELAA